MKRAISLLLTVLMVLSLFPATALAAEESILGEGDVAAVSATPETSEQPVETPAPELTPTEALPSESPTAEALYINLLDCNSIDADGIGHVTRKVGSADQWDLTLKCETNGDVFYRWQTLDQTSTAGDPYVDIDTKDNPTADEKTLTIPANAEALGVKDYFRCVVTATSGEESIVSYCCFTIDKIDDAAENTPTPAPELPLTPEGALDMTTAAGQYYAMSMEDVIYAIQSGKTNIICSGSFSITTNLTIPAGYSLSIYNNYYTVTVSSNVTLTNKGTINVHSMGYLDISGTLSNYGTVECSNGGTMTVYDGAHYQAVGSSAKLIRSEESEGAIALINGVSYNQIQYVFIDTTGYGFYTGFEYAQADYLSKEIFLTAPAEIDGTNHATIPAGAEVYMQSDMEIASGATLTNNGSLYVLEGATLTNHGTIENNGDLYVFGTIDSDGTITGNPYDYLVDVTSDESLRAAIVAGASVLSLRASFSLSGDVTIPSGTILALNGYTLTVPSGSVLTLQGRAELSSLGKLLIKSGAGLINSGDIGINGGALTVESGGTYQAINYASILLDIGKAGTVTGISNSNVSLIQDASTEAMIRTALTYGGKGYQNIQIYVLGSISLASNMTIPEDVWMFVGFDGDGYRLTVPTGKTLTNNGYINVRLGNTLQINTGATLANNGQIEVNGEFINNGTATGSGSITFGDETVDSWATLLAAVEAKRANITLSGDVTMEDDLTIGNGSTLILPNDGAPTLTIPDGITLTVNGYLSLQGGNVVVQSGGKLVLNGNVFAQAGSFTVEDGGLLENDGYFDLSGTASATLGDGTYVGGAQSNFHFNDSEGATLSSTDLSFVSYSCKITDDTALASALASASGYKSYYIELMGDAELSSVTIPANVYLSVESGSTLKIPADNTVELSGTIDIRAGATLQILAGASINIDETGLLNISGVLDNSGTINGDYSLSVSTEDQLNSKIASGVKMLTITENITLTGDVTIPSGVSVNLWEATLTVPSGKTLQIDGSLSLSSGTVSVLASGKLKNKGEITLFDGSRLTIASGASYTQELNAFLSFTYGVDTINGISKSLIDCEYLASNESQLRTGLALSGYRSVWVKFSGDVTLTSNLTVPANVTLMLLPWIDSAKITVPSLKTLTVNGIVSLQEGSILTIATGGTLSVSAIGSVQVLGGKLIVNGTANYATGAQVYRQVYNEAELIDAVASKTTQIVISDDIELTDDLSIPNGMELLLTDGKTLTVPSGTALNIGNSKVWINSGALDVQGALALANGGTINIDDSGTFTLSGDISFGGADAKIIFNDTGSSALTGISGDAETHVIAQIFVANSTELAAALTKFGAYTYGANKVMLADSIQIEDDISVPAGVQLFVEDSNILTIPVGKTLTIEPHGELIVQNGGKLILLGTLENQGMVTLALGALFGNGTIIDDPDGLSFSANVTTFAQLKAAIDADQRPIKIYASGFVISANLTIPEGVEVCFVSGSTGSIASGVTLTNNGKLTLAGKFTIAGTLINNNYFVVEKSGNLTNNNALTNNADADVYGTMINNATVTVKAGCRIRFHADAVKGGTKAAGTWYSVDGQTATGIEIVGSAYMSITATEPQQYIAQMIPSSAWPMEVSWSVVSGDSYATIDEATGALHARAKGDVVIRATATDDDTIYSEMTVHIVSYALVIKGADWLVSGKSLQLSADFIPSNISKTTVVWSLADGDSAYASISASGLVTAKALTEMKEITVIARSADGSVDESQLKITIHPAMSGMQIISDGESVTGKTLNINSYNDESLIFTCLLIPFDAKPEIAWVLSETDVATLVDNGDGSVTLTPKAGKAKLLTLTAKSTDGSGKTASVMIQVAAVSSGVTVSGAKDDMLNTGKDTQLIAIFSDPQPSNTAVKWTLSPEYDAFATLSAKGVLTAKTVTEAVVVEVIAVPADGGPASDPYQVTINPLTSQVHLMRGEKYVTNTTQLVDLGHERSLTLTAVSWPYSASQEFTFSSSVEEIATVDEAGVVTLLKNGLVTITAEATDGSGKRASVRLNVVSLPQSIEAVSPVLALRGGSSATYRVKDTTTAANVILAASQVRWSLDGDFAGIASITTGGVLSTFAVNAPVKVTLKAEVIGNEEIATALVEVWVYPATQGIQLNRDGKPLTGAVVFDTYTMPDGGGESVTLTVKTLPEDAMQDVTWTSSNPAIATVKDGVVAPVWNTSTRAYNKGTATITAKTKDGTNLSASTTVQVVSLAQSIALTTASGVYELISGSSVQLKVTLGNPAATNPKVYYSLVSGAEFATVSASGLVTAKAVYKEQIITVKATAADGSCEDEQGITIQPRDPDLLVIQPLDGSVTYNGTMQSFDVKNGAVKLAAIGFTSGNPVAVKWTVSPSTVAKISIVGGVATLQSLKTGLVTVTAKDANGRTASFKAEFFKPATSLTINPPKGMDVLALTLASGKTMQLTGTIAPTSGVTTSGVNWYIGEDMDGGIKYYKETRFASVSSTGLVTAKAGLAETTELFIYAVTKNAPYLTKMVKITLTPAATGLDILLDGATVNNMAATMELATKTTQLAAIVYPDTASQSVVWTCSDKLVATIAADGKLTALKSGTVTITAKADGKVATFKLTIAVQITGLDIASKTGFTMRAGGTLPLTATLTPTNLTDKRVSWALLGDGAQFATISSAGVVTAKASTKQQKITVQATSMADKAFSDTQEITIYPATTKVLILDDSDVDVSGKTLILDLSEATEMTLSARNLPSMAGGALQSVIWKSNNTAVLRVAADGTLTPVKRAGTELYYTGTVTITATATDGSGKSATVKVFVGYLVEVITFSDGLTVKGGSTLALKPTFGPANATNKAVKWTIKASDTPYATISSTGVISAKKLTSSRVITIYCEALDGSGTQSEVTVTITG